MNIKRLISCLSLLIICFLSNMGLDVKALPLISNTPKIINKMQQDADFILYSGTETISSENIKIADHYSHYSHSSHRSHYSSRY